MSVAVHQKKRSTIQKDEADEKEKENVNLVKLEGVDGLWYEQPDILSKYKRRPDTLERMCYTHFGKMIKSGGKRDSSGNSDENGPD